MRAAALTDPAVVPVWNMQRSFRLDRVCTLLVHQRRTGFSADACAASRRQAEAIARAKRHDASLGLPGVVTLYELPDTSGRDVARFRAILDGQHRVGALRLLTRGGGAADASAAPWERVLVEVFPVPSEAAAAALFTEINSAQPVMLVDLPDAAGGAAPDDKAALEGAALALAGAPQCIADACCTCSMQLRPAC